MLFNIKEALVIDAFDKKYENPITRSPMQAQRYAGRTTTFPSSAGFVTVLLRAMLSQVLLCSTRSWFYLWGSRLFSPWPLCLPHGLARDQLALESALANLVVVLEISVRDAVAAAPSDGQHLLRSCRERFP